jgi:hypothetical protein
LKQTTINRVFKKGLKEDVCKDIVFFFILFFTIMLFAFNVARSVEYLKIFESLVKHSLWFKLPYYHEIRVKYLDFYYGETSKVVAGLRLIGSNMDAQ